MTQYEYSFIFCVGGVSFEDDADMEVELSMTVEEQLKYSLDSLHDAVIKQHSITAAADSCTFYPLLT